jgi:phosphatidylinositol kinase/protein kinase (PI-3  family)
MGLGNFGMFKFMYQCGHALDSLRKNSTNLLILFHSFIDSPLSEWRANINIRFLKCWYHDCQSSIKASARGVEYKFKMLQLATHCVPFSFK